VTEEGELYRWGAYGGNGHGVYEPTPRQVAAFVGQHVKHMTAGGGHSSCVVTEMGELYTWGEGGSGHLGHGNAQPHDYPKRVDGLSGVQVTVAATCRYHTLVADEDGVVWAFGQSLGLGLGYPGDGLVDPDDVAGDENGVWQPVPIPTLRVRARKSPDVLPFL